jgi:CRP-like cAMP-binding protein
MASRFQRERKSPTRSKNISGIISVDGSTDAPWRASKANVEICTAETDEEREAVFRLRHDVYVSELGEYRTEARDGLLTDPSDDAPNVRQVYAATPGPEGSEGQVVAALRYHIGGPFSHEDRAVYDLDRFMDVVSGDKFAILSRFCAHAEYRQSIPMHLLLASLPFTKEDGVELLFCDCQPHLVSLYQRLGFRSYTAVYSDAVASVLVPLVLLRGDAEHFVRIGSPLGSRDVPAASVAIAASVKSLVRDGAVTRLDAIDEAPIPAETVFKNLQTPAVPAEDARSIFSGLSIDEVRAVLDASFELKLQKGDRLVRRGQATRTFYVVIRGRLEEREKERVVGTLGRGDVAGEVSLLVQGQRRIADVFAVEDDVVVLAVGEKAFRALVDSRSPTAAVFTLNLCRSIARKMVERSLLLSGPVDT